MSCAIAEYRERIGPGDTWDPLVLGGTRQKPETMFLSVLIPAYNEERYLPACLQALQQQTWPRHRFEVIVVDNASTDATPELARKLGAHVIDEPVKNIARARQVGFEAARGQIIASTDADTVVPPQWLGCIAEHFRRDPGLGAVCGPVHWADGRPHEQFIMKHPVTWALALSNRLGRSWWMGSNFAVRTAVFRQVDGFRGFEPSWMWGEDIYLSWKVSQIARILFDPELAVYTSARRLREGYGNYLRRAATNVVRVVILGQEALPTPDIR